MRTPKIQAILNEHASIREAIRAIEIELDRLEAKPPLPDEEWSLPERMCALSAQLKQHFEVEESTGILDTATRRQDVLQDIIVKLVDEHRRFEHEVERISNELACGFVPGETVQRCFDRDIRGLIEKLARHEAEENRLFDRLLSLEIAAGKSAGPNTRSR